MQVINPFFTTTVIPDEFFCDRKQETEDIIRILTNGNNLVLKGPRRMGKSGLIHHVFSDKRISGKYNTFYFDIYATSSLEEFTRLLAKALYDSLAGRGAKFANSFLQTIQSFTMKMAPDQLSGMVLPEFGYRQAPVPEHTLDELFDYLEKSSVPNVVAIDEFQTIGTYAEKNVEALLRTRIQRMSNTKFIFSGSEKHMLDIMFSSSDNPFYSSARSMDISRIPEDVYCRFAKEMFAKYGKSIEKDAISYVYNLFDGVTYYLQEAMNELFSLSSDPTVRTREDVEEAVRRLVLSNTSRCQDILSGLTLIQRKLLVAIAKEWDAIDITSAAFISRHGLASASSVQSATRALIAKKLIVNDSKTYSLPDKYLALWIRINQ